MTAPTPVLPKTSPSVVWVTGTQVLALPKVAKATGSSPTTFQTTLATESAALASAALYRLSGSEFSGATGPVTVRPVSRPVDIDSRSFNSLLAGYGLGYSGSWGVCAFGTEGVYAHYGCSNPRDVDLGAYPVTSIVEVTIDGVVIPADEYELRDFRRLVRMRPTSSSVPTSRWGWPTCQIPDLALGQVGTFGVTFTYGAPPPTEGVRAAKVLAQEIWLSGNGDPHRLPARTSSANAQGISVSLNDMTSWLANRRTGLMEVDLWLASLEQAAPGAWSPNVARARRVPS